MSIDIKLYDYDPVDDNDQADITPKSGRTLETYYNLIEDKLYYSDDTEVPKTNGFYELTGTPDDNARIKFDVSDSYDPSDYPPKLDAPDAYSLGKKSSHGSFSGSFTIENNQTHPWSKPLVIESVSIVDGNGWISSATPSSTTIGPSGTATIIRALTYGNGLYVYAGNSGVLATSTDAITWTARTSGTASAIYALTYGNGLYVYAGTGGVLATSTDAITWDARTSGTTSNIATLTIFLIFTTSMFSVYDIYLNSI